MKIILLIISTLLSTLAMYFSSSESWIQTLYYLGPGIFFSAFLIFISRKTITGSKAILLYLALVILWFISYWLSIHTGGMLAPILGGGSAWLIGKYIIFENQNRKLSRSLILRGAISSFIGLFSFYSVFSESNSLGMVAIVLLWQLSVGAIYIDGTIDSNNTAANTV
jgi:hypothetical protein